MREGRGGILDEGGVLFCFSPRRVVVLINAHVYLLES